MRGAIARGAVPTLAALLVGCTQIPTHELSQYRAAFHTVHEASVDILVDFAAAKAAAERLAQPPTAPRPAGPFATGLQDFAPRQPDAIEVRRLALRTVDRYNTVLATLAEGKSVEALQGAAAGFVQSAARFAELAAGVALPGAPAVTGMLGTLIGAFERARLREEFIVAVRDGAPVVDRILAILDQDRSAHLELRAAEAQLRAVDLVDGMQTHVVAIRDLFRARSRPAGDDPRGELEEALNAALEPAREGLALPSPMPLAYGTGSPPFHMQERAVAESAITQVRDLAVRYRDNVAQLERLRSALNSYGAMLAATRAALRTLALAVDQPARFEEVAEQLLATAFTVRQHLEAYKAARRSAG